MTFTANSRALIISAALLATLTGVAAQPAFAADKMVKTAMVETVDIASAPAPFQRRNKTLKGSVQIVKQADGSSVIRLSDDFRASNGPDLKIFLNPNRVADVTGTTATNGAVLVSRLEKNKGSYDYRIPAGVNLAEFGSVLIHCEAFSVLWGGADIG